MNFDHKLFETTGLFYPKECVSGDYYDFIWFEKENRLCGCIIDVMGHGMGAGLMVRKIRST
jgi:serine phosphatase RsbU (regulator of sigma subunit)